MRQLVAVQIFLAVLFSCNSELGALPQPDGLIPEDKMVDILTDLTVIEAHIQMNNLQVARYKKLMERSGDELLRKYKINRVQFESSMDYYGSRQEKMQEIYARVLDSLNLMSGKIIPGRDVYVENKTIADSMKNIPERVRRALDRDK